MATEIYDARTDPDVILLSPYYTDEFRGSRALAYIRKSDNLPRRVDFGPDGVRDFLCPVKLFNPMADFWIAFYDPQTGMAYGVAEMQWQSGPCREAGDLDLREIITTRGPHGFIVERDLSYTPRLFSAILAEGE